MTPTTPGSTAQILKTDTRGRVRLPKEKQEALLDEFEKSGMSGQAFAAWAGVKYPSFAHWRTKRRKERGKIAPADNPIKWVEAVVAQAPTPVGTLVIHLPGGVRVEASSVQGAAEFVLALGAGRC
jgi:hypothetical protein